MARRKARLTVSKKKSKAKAADPDAPTDNEWESMKPFNSFACKFAHLCVHVFLIRIDSVRRRREDL